MKQTHDLLVMSDEFK